jgi:hypothetical protein
MFQEQQAPNYGILPAQEKQTIFPQPENGKFHFNNKLKINIKIYHSRLQVKSCHDLKLLVYSSEDMII